MSQMVTIPIELVAPQPPEHWTLREAAAYLHIKDAAARRYAQKGILKNVNKFGKKLLFRRADVEALLAGG